MICAGPQRNRQDVVAAPGPSFRHPAGRVQTPGRAMTIIQEITLSIAIAMCAFAAGRLIWSALAAVW
jgi:hypothetical protein